MNTKSRKERPQGATVTPAGVPGPIEPDRRGAASSRDPLRSEPEAVEPDGEPGVEGHHFEVPDTGSQPEPALLEARFAESPALAEPSTDAAPTARRGHRGAPGKGGLVRYDPLRAYMAEVARHSVLSRAEEHALAVRYYQTGDVQAAYKLVASNLRLVVKIAHEYRRAAFQLLDLIQEGNMGLMQAVKKYDPFKGVKLSSYAAWWIRAYIIRFIMDNWRTVKLGTTQAQRKLFFNLSKEREKLLARGIEPTPRLLARNLRVEEKDVEEMSARMAGDDLSLDAPLRGEDVDSHQTRLDRLASPEGPAADERIGDEELKRLFRGKLESFARTLADPREKTIFEKRLLPPDGTQPLTLQEIGAKYGLTRERARQIEGKLTSRLREYLKAEIPDFELLTPPD
jgi:RNA polymerase sigma-32 factor